MPTLTATSLTGGISTEQQETHDRGDGRIDKRKTRLIEWAARKARSTVKTRGDVWIEPYAPYLIAPNGWLSVLEARVRDSVVPDEYQGEPSTEWLSEKTANAAIAFFRLGADLLPTEPHIYATISGDLVAEFQTPGVNITSVVSDAETVLFAVLRSDPNEPVQQVIRRGSNQFRDELRSFFKKLTAKSHATMAAEG
jgi:hypothetical protein